jgi:uncharacterized lipoprotein YbaY
MHIRRCSSLALLALAGCGKKESPTPDPSASAAPPATIASAAPVPATEVTKVRVALAPEGQVVYLQIKHPNAPVADILNRLFKSEADKRVDEAKVHAAPGVRFIDDCEGDFPTQDVL